MHWVVALSWLQLTRLIADDALYRTASVRNRLQNRLRHRPREMVCPGLHRLLHQALLDTLKGTLIISVPVPLYIFLE